MSECILFLIGQFRLHSWGESLSPMHQLTVARSGFPGSAAIKDGDNKDKLVA